MSSAWGSHSGAAKHRKEQVEEGADKNDRKSFPDGLIIVSSVFFRLRNLFLFLRRIRLSQHLHIAAEGDSGDKVFGFAVSPPHHLRTEAEGKLQHLYPQQFGEKKMPEFVNEDQGSEKYRSIKQSHRLNSRTNFIAFSRAHLSAPSTSSRAAADLTA